MTRLKISIFIMLSFVLISTISCRWINKKCDEMIFQVREISDSFSSGDTENAVLLAQHLDGYWEEFRKKASVMVKTERLSETDMIISGIAVKIKDTPQEVNYLLSELSHMILLLKSSETPSFSNIL